MPDEVGTRLMGYSQGLNEIKVLVRNELEIESEVNLKTNKEFSNVVTKLGFKQQFWSFPRCFAIISCIQLMFYVIANDCIYRRLIFIYDYRYEYWRYVTYMLLHADLIHLLLNIVLQCFISFSLENEQGQWRVFSVFVSGGVSGSLATSLIKPHLSILGASAGVYAILTSHVPHLLKNFSTLHYRYLRIICLCILCLSDVSYTVYHYILNYNRNPRICVEAHFAGAFCGLCIGFLVYKKNSYNG